MTKMSSVVAFLFLGWAISEVIGLRVGDNALRMKFPSSSASNFPRAEMLESLPKMDELTLCFGVKITGETSREHFIISYALSDTQSNEILVSIDPSSKVIKLRIKSILAIMNCNSISVGQWQRVCVSWRSAGGVATFYVDDSLCSGVVNNVASGLKIEAGGKLVIGQEQDNLGGGYDPNQSLVGDIVDFMIWNEILDSEQISRISKCLSKACKSSPCCFVEEEIKGNIVNWLQNKYEIYDGAEISSTTICK
ncbi:C-reactive protein 1.1-like [Tachypleus tridentatus]|uniref:C-reactive protein 1.1-like n=1 Tax=Tachypleus tridentatus TaxID=6853 RepID=UPI003FD375B2